MENKNSLIKQRSSELKKAQAAALVRQMSRLSSGSELPPTPSARPRIRVTAGLSRKLSRRLDISFDKLDISAFPFQFLNATVSCEHCQVMACCVLCMDKWTLIVH